MKHFIKNKVIAFLKNFIDKFNTLLNYFNENKIRAFEILFGILNPLFLFGFWLIELLPEDTYNFGKYSLQGWMWVTGLGLSSLFSSIMTLLKTNKWNKVSNNLSISNIGYSVIITYQGASTYYNGGGGNWTDFFILPILFVIIFKITLKLSKLIPKQKLVEQYDARNKEIVHNINDTARVTLSVIKNHFEVQEMKESIEEVRGKKCIKMDYKLLKDSLEDLNIITKEIIKNRIL